MLKTIQYRAEEQVKLFLAKKFGHNLNSKNEIKNFLDNVDPELLIQASYTDFAEENVIKESKQRWVPLAEVSDAKDPFLLRSPREILEQKSDQDIDLMIGITSDVSLQFQIKFLRIILFYSLFSFH